MFDAFVKILFFFTLSLKFHFKNIKFSVSFALSILKNEKYPTAYKQGEQKRQRRTQERKKMNKKNVFSFLDKCCVKRFKCQ